MNTNNLKTNKAGSFGVKRILIVILSVLFSSLVFGVIRNSNQQNTNQQADQVTGDVDEKWGKLYEAKDKDPKVELSSVQELKVALTTMESMLKNSKNQNSPDTVAAVAYTKSAKEGVSMIENGLLNADSALKEKGYKILDSLSESE